MAEAGAEAAAEAAANRRRRMLGCAVLGLLVMALLAEPLLVGSSDSSGEEVSALQRLGTLPMWLRAAARLPVGESQADRRALAEALKSAHPVGRQGGSPPPANLSSLYRGVWATPRTRGSLRKVPLGNTTLLPSLLSWGTAGAPTLRKGSGEIHMSLAASPTDIDGVVRLAAAARIADGTGPASRDDLFLTPLSGFYTPSTGDFSMGLDATFRAPGAQNVGRYMAPGRSEHGPVVLVLEGTIASPDCGFVANFTTASVVLNKDAALLSGAVYAFIMSVLAILHFAGTVRAILDGLSAQVAASRSSVAAVAVGTATDAWLAIAHGGLALVVEDVSTGFGLVAIVLLLCFSVLEVRLMLTILKAQEPDSFDNMDAVRRVISRLYGRFYAGLFASVAVAFLLPSAWPLLVFVATSLWVPQIIHSARLGAPHGMRTSYVVISTLLRMFPILYVLGCPASFLVELGLDAYQPTLAASIAAWVSLQLVILVMQQSFGAQFLVPTALLPEKYDYYRPVLVRDGRVAQADDDHEDNDGAAGGAPAAHPGPDCLRQWFNVKMQCPTCRAAVPEP
ncbi:hypothetical protein FNF27_02670 [Cafeteria roenbergensis]|uniref:RING-type E3 ubiquitin transferase n=1 Tax=Cafeteria roenbergensis TaxID=33653 RepID=A0A5A8EEF6_CAFRO|nr:hypothetical protein FNF27_02670 [Cafeteria roenbergensis]